MEDLISVKEELDDKKAILRQLENDLKNIENIALENLDRDLKVKIEKLHNKIEKEREQLDIKVGNMKSMKSQMKEKKTIITQYVKGVNPSQDKSKQLAQLKAEVSNLEASIEASKKVYDRLEIEKEKKLKVLVKEISTQRKEMIIKIKKEIKLLEQVYDYKLKGKI